LNLDRGSKKPGKNEIPVEESYLKTLGRNAAEIDSKPVHSEERKYQELAALFGQ